MSFHRLKHFVFALISGLFFFSTGYASIPPSGIMAVIDPGITSDNRPLLWLNFQQENSEPFVKFIKGKQYDYLTVLTAPDTTFIFGINTAGFACCMTFSPDLPGNSSGMERQLLSFALSNLNRIDDLEKYLRYTNKSGRTVKANFACLDASGKCAVFEISNNSLVLFEPTQYQDTLPALVRSNFAISATDPNDCSVWQYHRTLTLLKHAAAQNILDYKFMLQTVSRDILPENNETTLWNKDTDKKYNTTAAINQHTTQAAIVVQGVHKNESPTLTTLWLILGEPITGVAIPLWASAGNPTDKINDFIKYANKTKREFRPFKNEPFLLDIDKFLKDENGKRSKLVNYENENFLKTRQILEQWNGEKPDFNSLLKFENKLIKNTLRKLR